MYLDFATGLIQIEGKLAHFYLHPDSFLRVVELLESTIIGSHQDKILGGLPTLLDAEAGWQSQARAITSLYEFFD